MKKISMALTLVLFLLFTFTESIPVYSENNDDFEPEIVYLDDADCEDCKAIRASGILESLESQGITVTTVDIYDDLATALAYLGVYQIPITKQASGTIFAGDEYFIGFSEVNAAYTSGQLTQLAQEPLRDISEYEPVVLEGWSGLAFVIVTGLLDGINPCAIAMLLMFISMIGFTKNRRVLLTVSISYIGAIFITYFFIGVGLLTLLNTSRAAFTGFSFYLYLSFAILCFILFAITLYDFFVTKNEQYGKIKNQLPKRLQALNKRIMAFFTKVIDSDETSPKQALLLVGVPFLIGIIIGITEAACTGQLYLILIATIESNMIAGSIRPQDYMYLLIFNLMFITPLIIIALIAILSRSVVGVSNFIRIHLPKIKLATSIFFFIMMFYFILLTFNYTFISFFRGIFT